MRRGRSVAEGYLLAGSCLLHSDSVNSTVIFICSINLVVENYDYSSFMKSLFILVLFALASCSTLPKAVEPNSALQYCSGKDEVYVISHGWHTGIAIKAADLNKLIPALAIRFPHVKYYEIGWGDAGFYQANEITTQLTLRALFWSSGSVLHIVGFSDNPKQYFYQSKVQEIKMGHENYVDLLEFIQSSFQTDLSKNIIREKHGIYDDSQFYTGVGTYHLFNTSNKWTAKALYSAGLNISPMLKLTSASVMNSLEQQCLQ